MAVRRYFYSHFTYVIKICFIVGKGVPVRTNNESVDLECGPGSPDLS